MGSPLGLWWFAPVLSGGGYGSEAMALLLGLHQTRSKEIPVRATHHGDMMDYEHFSSLPHSSREALEATLRSPVPSPENAVVVCHSEPGAWHPAMYQTTRCPPAATAVAVGRTMFETDRLDPEHVRRINLMHEVWVPSSWSADVFAASGVQKSKIKVVPEAVDVERFDADVVKSLPKFDLEAHATQVLGPPIANGESKKFLSVFKWEARKAPEILLSAYLDEFTSTDDVALFLRCDLYHEIDGSGTNLVADRVKQFAREAVTRGNAKWVNKNKDIFQNAPRVFVLPWVSEQLMPSLYHAFDAFVLPSRGEGWGRPHVEAMAVGVPIIATNWSGPTAFMSFENSYPLAIENELVSLPSDSHWVSHKWADPDVKHLQELMRTVYSNPKQAKAKGRIAARDIRERFSPEAVACVVLGHVKRLSTELEARRKDETKSEL